MPRVWNIALAIIFVPSLAASNSMLSTGPLRQLRFSWDGKSVLVQNDSQITVLAAEPFSVLLRIPAADATLAHFSPDSGEVVFAGFVPTASPANLPLVTPHVERWSIKDRARAAYSSLPPMDCAAEAIAPDGRTLACNGWQGTLRVIDVTSGEKVLEKQRFAKQSKVSYASQIGYRLVGDTGQADLKFSPDGQYLVAVPYSEGTTVVWDTRARRMVKTSAAPTGSEFRRDGFIFLTSDRALVSRHSWGNRPTVPAKIVSFPEGRTISHVRVARGPEIIEATDPAFVIVLRSDYLKSYPGVFGLLNWPFPTTIAIISELGTGQNVITGTPPVDIFGRLYVTEIRRNVVALFERGKGLLASVVLNQN